MKKTLSALLALILALSLCAGAAFAAPPAPPTKEADDYTGPVITYPDKELWFDTTVYGGFYSAYQIMKGNGDDTFDVDAFINSRQGELVMSRIKYELALVGDSNYASQTMIDYWAAQGVIETAYNSDDPEHEWLTYVPEYMYDEENAGKVYPVVFSHHGNGGTLFEATDHGFVHICYEEGFMVVVPENENSDPDVSIEMLPKYLDELEAKGYPIDRSRVYVSGMSKGAATSLKVGLACSDIVAAIAPHSASFGMLMEGTSIQSYLRGSEITMTGSITQEQLDNCGGMPIWMQVGESDMNQLPFAQGMIDSLNAWLAMNDCPTKAVATDSNAIGITADRVYTAELDGTTYTFAEFYNTAGIKTMVIVGVAGLPHWVSYSFSKLAWDFMSQYSIVDGQRVYTAKTPTYYSDVDNDADYAAAVQTVTEAGLMKGIGVNTFAPDGTVTRAQAITVLGRLADAVPTDVYGIADVKPGSWYSGYVGWAVSNGIVKLNDGKFNPNGTLIGTELDEIFRAYGDLIGVDYINFPNNNNTMTFGPTGPVFVPSAEPVTRGELASRLVKLMNAPVDYDYEGKELWFDTTVYGGFYSAYLIYKGNGSPDFDMPAFVNSKAGEDTLNRIKYELCILGDQNYASDTMIQYWAGRGIVEKVYNRDDVVTVDNGQGGTKEYRPNEWIAYIPDYIRNDGTSTEKCPVVFCFHGGGGSLFEATNHGFVEICREEGFIVIVPENNNMEHDLTIANLTNYTKVLADEGYPIDFDRIYTSGHSMGGIASMACAIRGNDVVAASSATGCVGLGIPVGPDAMGGLDWPDFAAAGTAPMYFMVGGKEMKPHLPLSDEAFEGFNAWLKQNGCTAAVRTDESALGFTADRVYELEIDGQTHTFGEYYNADGELMVVFVLAENTTHWAPYSHAKLAWNFLRNFSK